MKKGLKIIILAVILTLIAIVLFMTGKRHDIVIENNTNLSIKYSINGENYKTLESKKRAKTFSKGFNNVIYLKASENKVIEKELPPEDVYIYIKESIDGSKSWYKGYNG